MRLVPVFFFWMLSIVTATAQQIEVLSTNGLVKRHISGSLRTLAAGESLSPEDVLDVERYGFVNLMDHRTRDIYCHAEQGLIRVCGITDKKSVSALKRFYTGMVRALRRGETVRIDRYAPVIYRDPQVEAALLVALQEPAGRSGYPVSLELIDPGSGLPLSASARVGGGFYFRVSNRAAEPLFVNVVSIDAAGEMSVCLPMDEGGTLSHALIPAGATVDLREFPMRFGLPAGRERLVLLACERPFDLRRVTDTPQQKGTGSASPNVKVGKYTMTIQITE